MSKFFKNLIIAILIVLTYSCSTTKKVSKNNNLAKFKLKWNVNDTIKYRTIIKTIDDIEFDIDFKNTFGKIVTDSASKMNDNPKVKNDSTKNELNSLIEGDLFKDMKSKIEDINNNTELVTVLTESSFFENIIDIEMIRYNLKPNDSLEYKNIFSGTQLKGTIYKDGSLHSFWLNNAQRNLISLFYELPIKEIKKGDVWGLKHLNYVQYNNVFYCNNAKKKNEVTLVDVIKRNGETIALIEYDIYEFVEGNLDLFGNKTRSNMKMEYKAKGEFSIEKGKWISYTGFLSIETIGMMSSKSKQKFELIEK
jgi:hypothetical protein